MSIIQVKTRSACMTKPMTFTLFLPNDVPPMMTEGNPCYDRPTKTLVLLHGYTADSFEWLYYSTPDDIAVKYNLAVAVLDCDNAFYLDRPGTGNNMGRYIGEEIPGICGRPSVWRRRRKTPSSAATPWAGSARSTPRWPIPRTTARPSPSPPR